MQNASENILDYGGSNPWDDIINNGTPPGAMPTNPQYVFLWDPDSTIVKQLYGKVYHCYAEGNPRHPVSHCDWYDRTVPYPNAQPFPKTFGDGWLYYQWASNLGPAYATGMTSEEIAAWNASSPIYVLNNQNWQQPVTNALDQYLSNQWNFDNRNQWKFSVTVYCQYVSAWLAMNAMWPGHVDDWWYMMYALNNNPYGNEMVTQWIYDHPDAPAAVKDAILNNHVETYQQQYGLLNEPILTDTENEPWNTGGIADWQVGQNNYGDNYWNVNPQKGPFFKPLGESNNPHMRWGFPLWTYHQRYVAYMTILPAVAVGEGGNWTIKQQYLSKYLQVYLDNGWILPNGTVPPIYDPKKPPVKINPPVGGPGGISTPITDPNYAGNLPYSTPSLLPHQAPWSGPQGGPQHGYSPCQKESGVLIATPPIGAFILTFLSAPLLPDDVKAVGAATVAGTSYLFLRQTLGMTGEDGEVWSKVNAASWLAVGGPATLAALLYGTNDIPANKGIFMGAAGAAGYVFLNPPLLNLFKETSQFTVPIANILNKILTFVGHWVSPACWDQDTSAGACPCQYQYEKDQTRSSLLTTVYGTSGAQQTMRNQCLQVAMLQGNWGSDPKSVGPKCDMKTDTMPNPAACMNPAWWTAENINGFPDPNLQSMFSNISPCLDPANPSFLPPGYRLTGTGQSATLVFDQGLATKDEACQAQGKYFRSTPTGCQNFSNIN